MVDVIHPRLDWHLDNWARWHRVRSDLEHLTCKTETLWAGTYDSDREAESADSHQAEVVDAIIHSRQCAEVPDGFTPVERGAVFHIHLGVAVFRMNREPIELVYLRGRLKLSRWLVKKGIP